MSSNIPSTPADGNILTVLVPAIALPDRPTITEVTGIATAIISCYLTRDGFALTTDQATITDERECSTQVYGKAGTKTYGLSITGVDNTNTEFALTDNVLADTLIEGASMFAVRRRGKAFSDPLLAGDLVSVIPFDVGVKSEVPPEANSVLRSTWNCFVSGDVLVDVAILAGP